jgi:Ni/Fe-hydrogenase 1 B-type cytochrome subunit
MSTPNQALKLPVYVWELPVRIWHWVMAACLVVLWVTGYLVGKPLASVGGEATEHFLMGYIRFVHFSAGFVFTAVLVLRIYWAIVGNKYAREIFLVPLYVFRPSWWRDFFRTVQHYLFILPKADLHIGHNPLAMIAMFAMYVLGSLFLIVTGFALYGEGTGAASFMFKAFSSWVIPLFGQSQDVHTWHRLASWFLLWFTMVHLYFATREDLTSGVTVIGSILNGWRRSK